MVAEGRENGRVGEVLGELTHRGLDRLQVGLAGLVPHVVRGKVARPDDVVDVLKYMTFQ